VWHYVWEEKGSFMGECFGKARDLSGGKVKAKGREEASLYSRKEERGRWKRAARGNITSAKGTK